MQITRVSVGENRRFVPVKGWDSVEKAITLFADGRSRASRETERVTVDDIEQRSGALGVGMFLLGSLEIGSRSTLVDQMLKEAKQALTTRATFDKHYDYDGMGTSFFKTSVTIKKLGDDMYGIGLYAAYAGDKPESGLAESLSIPRALVSCSIEVESAPLPDSRFEFDFEPVLRMLDGLLDTKDITGVQVAEAMMTEDTYGESRPVFSLPDTDGMRITIHPGRVERRFDYQRDGARRDTWSVNGSVFAGELGRDWNSDDENVKAPPTFCITISSAEELDLGYRKEAAPMWNPEQQQKALAFAKRIATMLQ